MGSGSGCIKYLGSRSYQNLCISGKSGHRDLPHALKCPQWLHSYMSCEATCTLKCSLFEKISKKTDFCRCERWKISFSQFARKISIFRYMLLHNSNINVLIAHILLYQNCSYGLPGRKYKNGEIIKWARWKWAWFLEMSHDWKCVPKSKVTIRVL